MAKENQKDMVGLPTDEIDETCSPSLRRLLQNMLHEFQLHPRHISVRQCAVSVCGKYLRVWEKFQVPMKKAIKITDKLETEYNTWIKVKKNKFSTTTDQVNLRKEFSERLDTEFDVRRIPQPIGEEVEGEEEMNVEMMDIQVDQPEASTSGGTGSKERSGKILAREKIKEQAKRRRIDSLSDESPSMSTGGMGRDSPPYQSPSPGSPRQPKKRVLTEEVFAIIDATALSDRVAFQIICGVAKALGFNVVEDLVLSYQTLMRARSDYREKTAKRVKESFDPKFATVHWDGKLMKDVTRRKNVDRLPILLSQESGVKLLKVPKIDDGTGATQAEAVFEVLTEWNAVDDVTAMCFDTTPADTGQFNGACAILEMKLGRDLLKLACRHHVYELMLKGAFEAKKFLPTDAATMKILEDFKNAWDGMDQANYKAGISDPFIKSMIPPTVRDEIFSFATVNCRRDSREQITRNCYS